MRTSHIFIPALLAVCALAAAPSGAGEKRLVIGDPPPHTTGAYRPFIIPGEIEESDGLVELRHGRDITVWCPEGVARDKPDKAAAAKRFVESPFLPIGPVSVGYVGNAAGEALLTSLGVRYKAYDPTNPWDLGGNQVQVIVLGPGTADRLKNPAQEKALREQLSKRTLLVLPGADLSLLPFGLERGKTTLRGADAAGATVPDLPVFAGIRRDFEEFLRLADGQECDIVAGGPAWMLATSPACFAHVKNRSVSIVILAVAPESVPESARPSLTRIWCTLLANLNAGT